MQKKDGNFIGSRSFFKDKTKSGGDKLTIYLGEKDVATLLEEIQKNGGPNGIKLQVFIQNFEGKDKASLLVTDAPARAGGPAAPGQARFNGQAGSGNPRPRIAFKPKTIA